MSVYLLKLRSAFQICLLCASLGPGISLGLRCSVIKSSGVLFRGSYASLVAQLVKNLPAMQAKKQ